VVCYDVKILPDPCPNERDQDFSLAEKVEDCDDEKCTPNTPTITPRTLTETPHTPTCRCYRLMECGTSDFDRFGNSTRIKICDGSEAPEVPFSFGEGNSLACYDEIKDITCRKNTDEASFKGSKTVNSCEDKDCIVPTETETCICWEKTYCDGSNEFNLVCDNTDAPSGTYKYSYKGKVYCASSSRADSSQCDPNSRTVSFNGTEDVDNCEVEECQEPTPTPSSTPTPSCGCPSDDCDVCSASCDSPIVVSASGGGGGSGTTGTMDIKKAKWANNDGCCDSNGLTNAGESACNLLKQNRYDCKHSYGCLVIESETKDLSISHSMISGTCASKPDDIDLSSLGCYAGYANIETVKIEHQQQSEIEDENITFETFCDEIKKHGVKDCAGKNYLGCKCEDPTTGAFPFSGGSSQCSVRIDAVDYDMEWSFSGEADPCTKAVTFTNASVTSNGVNFNIQTPGSVSSGNNGRSVTDFEVSSLIWANVIMNASVSGNTLTVGFTVDFSSQSLNGKPQTTITGFNNLMSQAASANCKVSPINCPCCPGDCCNISDLKEKANKASKLDPQDPRYQQYANAVACFDAWAAMSDTYSNCSKDNEKCSASFTVELEPDGSKFTGKCEMTELIGGKCVTISGDNPYKKPCPQ